jgi:hypothetical protein
MSIGVVTDVNTLNIGVLGTVSEKIG